MWEIEQGLGLSSDAVYGALVIRSCWSARLAKLFQTYDALILPSAQVWPFPAEWRWPQSINGRAMDTYHRWMEVVIPASLAGLPTLAIPAGFGAQGLPMGMQVMGPVGADAKVLAMGQSWHRATDWPGRSRRGSRLLLGLAGHPFGSAGRGEGQHLIVHRAEHACQRAGGEVHRQLVIGNEGAAAAI